MGEPSNVEMEELKEQISILIDSNSSLKNKVDILNDKIDKLLELVTKKSSLDEFNAEREKLINEKFCNEKGVLSRRKIGGG